ncbi:CAP domain-containing protein [Symbiobacterium terraclitae]|uniref:CAP domain-containing protein n=1 Tax=Symbiobacterium terraclitae TaxID=557451 RepID=UPI0035B53BFD
MKFFKGLAIVLAVAAASLTMAAPASAATTYTYTYTIKVPARTNLASVLSWYFPKLNVTLYTPKTTAQTTQAKQPQTTVSQPAQQQPKQQTQPQTQPQTTAAVSGLTAAEQQMLNLVNQERAKAGLKPLQADLQLTRLARMKSQDMINRNYFSHNSPTYGSPFDMMKAYGVTYRTAGENIAGNQSVQAAHNALMNSPGHRANILNAQYTHIGIGIVEGGPYGMMFTQMFVGR